MIVTKNLIFVMTFLLVTPEAEGWKKSLDKDDIIVYTRRAESSELDEFLAKTTMEGTIDDFKRIITDIENIPNWVPDCKTAYIIESPNPTDIIYHMKLKVPFPFAARDVIQQIQLSESENELSVQIINRPNIIEVEKKYIRMQICYGEWVVRKVSDSEISVRFQYFADPGGEIPVWLVNSFIVKNPFISLKNLRKLMTQ